MSMNGIRSTNARPGGGYQHPVLPTSGRVGEVAIKPETWDEVLQLLQTVLGENATLNQVLQENNERVERVIQSKDSEIETAQKLYWDVRISVLGFKAKIMTLTGEIERLRSEAAAASEPSPSDAELRIKTEENEKLKKEISDLKASQYSTSAKESDELKAKISSLQSECNRLLSEKRSVEYEVTELQEKLKQKSSSPPQPKPRTNIITKQDGKIHQLEKERDEAKALAEKYRQKAEDETSSRNTAEQKWRMLQTDIENKQQELIEYRRIIDDRSFDKSQLEGKLKNLEAKIVYLEKEKADLLAKPQVTGEVSMVGGGGGGIKQRRMLNLQIEKANQLENECVALREQLSNERASSVHHKDKFDQLSSEIIDLRESVRNKEHQLAELQEQTEDRLYRSDQKIANLNVFIEEQRVRLQNFEEKNHTLEVELSRTMSALRKLQQQATNESKESNQDWNVMESEMDGLMRTVEEKDAQLEKLTASMNAVMMQLGNAEADKQRYMEKLKQKQQDCANYLDQIEAWKAQYETAQGDFAQERAVREKEASAVKTLRENRDELQREVGELRKRVTDQRIMIANFQSSSYLPDSTSYTREINISGSGGTRTGPYTGDTGSDVMAGFRPSETRRDDWAGTTGATAGRRYRNSREHILNEDYHGRQDYNDSPRHIPPYESPVLPPSSGGLSHHVPDPHLGNIEPMNQLDDPPPLVHRQTGGGNAPANAFPQFPMGSTQPQQERKGSSSIFDLPGEVQKMEAPVVDNCPICGRSGFKTQTDLEVHAARCC